MVLAQCDLNLTRKFTAQPEIILFREFPCWSRENRYCYKHTYSSNNYLNKFAHPIACPLIRCALLGIFWKRKEACPWQLLFKLHSLAGCLLRVRVVAGVRIYYQELYNLKRREDPKVLQLEVLSFCLSSRVLQLAKFKLK